MSDVCLCVCRQGASSWQGRAVRLWCTLLAWWAIQISVWRPKPSEWSLAPLPALLCSAKLALPTHRSANAVTYVALTFTAVCADDTTELRMGRDCPPTDDDGTMMEWQSRNDELIQDHAALQTCRNVDSSL